MATEKIMVVHRPSDGKWIVVPGVKVLSPGDTVVWKFVNCKSFAFDPPPAMFEKISKTAKTVEATVKPNPGYCDLDIRCEGIPAEGHSSPGIIID